jgi:signal transduction histidine kinase
VPLLFLTPLAALVLWWLAARTLAPLERLAGEVRRRDLRSLAPLATTDLPDEVAPLARALNALLARLQGALDAQRAFVADAAHELRSPLTALKLQLELLRRAGDPAETEAARAALAEGIGRASRLVEQLLALARAEPDAAASRERVDLAEVAGQAVADTLAFANSRGVALELSAPAPAFVMGDAFALGLLVRNLTDNAVRYGPRASSVVVRVGVESATVLLQVDDAGPGIAEAERERVFDRFYRGGAQAEQGAGLGLPIVRGVANAHRATVELGVAPAGGLRVSVRLPATP